MTEQRPDDDERRERQSLDPPASAFVRGETGASDPVAPSGFGIKLTSRLSLRRRRREAGREPPEGT